MNQRYQRPQQETNNTPAAIKAKELTREVSSFEPQIKNALPKQVSAQRMTRIIITEISKNPQLAECERGTFYGAILQCAQLGLEPGSALGHAYLVPTRIKGRLEVNLITGFQGMIDLVERDGRVTMDAHCVFENDHFEIEQGSHPKLVHKPAIKDRGELIGAYAIATYKDGRFKFRFLNKDEIDEAKKAYNEMAAKTAIRRLFKKLPKTTELARVLELEERHEIGESQNLQDIAPAALGGTKDAQESIDVEIEEVTPEEFAAELE
jgi:recombination protein RecT